MVSCYMRYNRMLRHQCHVQISNSDLNLGHGRYFTFLLQILKTILKSQTHKI